MKSERNVNRGLYKKDRLSKSAPQHRRQWDKAIADAEEMIREERAQIARLEQSILSMKDLRDSGVPFPAAQAEQQEAKP